MNDASMNSINQIKEMIETEKESKADYLRPNRVLFHTIITVWNE